jgi:hypothetical protein
MPALAQAPTVQSEMCGGLCEIFASHSFFVSVSFSTQVHLFKTVSCQHQKQQIGCQSSLLVEAERLLSRKSMLAAMLQDHCLILVTNHRAKDFARANGLRRMKVTKISTLERLEMTIWNPKSSQETTYVVHNVIVTTENFAEQRCSPVPVTSENLVVRTSIERRFE